ncbi:MAG TPA: hypothetical protein VJB57_01395 [Dehalococcoidia bacterium]|nr:hypothetical protein [Dehalococcoidia bacterium]
MAEETSLVVVEGPKGKAEIFEVAESNQAPVYQVRISGQKYEFKSLGEAYIEAGEKAGTKT